MNDRQTEIAIELDAKRLLALSVLAIITVSVMYSYIIALFAFVAPSASKPLHINTVSTTDFDGVTKTSFARGDNVAFSIAIEHGTDYYYNLPNYYDYYSFTEATSYLVLVQVMKGTTPVFLGFVKQPISPGGVQTMGVGYRIAGNAPLGQYTATVLVWSDWLPDGSVLADNSAQEVSFTVG